MTHVKRLPKDPGPAAWAEILPKRTPSSELSETVTADWLVIGAGFAGLAAARRLSQLRPEDKIIILEAARVGDGPSGRNSGFMIDLPHNLASDNYGGAEDADRAEIEDNRRAIAFAQETAAALGLPSEAIDPCGKVNGAATSKGRQHVLDYKSHLDRIGEDNTLLDADEMHKLTGTSFYKIGLATPGTCMVQPAMYVRGVANGLKSNRVHLHENSPVTELKRNGDWLATTPKGAVTAPNVILAVNGHLQSFGHMAGRLVHTHTYASMTRALTPDEVTALGGQTRWNVIPGDPLGTTVRRISGTGGDRIVVRNRFSYDPGLEPGPRWLEQATRDHDKSFAARFPMLAGVDMEYRWGGRLCISLNNVQVIAELEPGLYSACVQNGLGTAKGTLAGMLAAELACGKTSPALTRALAAPKPQRLPPEPIAAIGANLRMRWGEFRAGLEK